MFVVVCKGEQDGISCVFLLIFILFGKLRLREMGGCDGKRSFVHKYIYFIFGSLPLFYFVEAFMYIIFILMYAGLKGGNEGVLKQGLLKSVSAVIVFNETIAL